MLRLAAGLDWRRSGSFAAGQGQAVDQEVLQPRLGSGRC